MMQLPNFRVPLTPEALEEGHWGTYLVSQTADDTRIRRSCF